MAIDETCDIILRAAPRIGTVSPVADDDDELHGNKPATGAGTIPPDGSSVDGSTGSRDDGPAGGRDDGPAGKRDGGPAGRRGDGPAGGGDSGYSRKSGLTRTYRNSRVLHTSPELPEKRRVYVKTEPGWDSPDITNSVVLEIEKEMRQRHGTEIEATRVTEWPSNPSTIVLAICLVSSRVGSNMKHALRGVTEGDSKQVVMLLLHPVEPHVRPPLRTADALYDDEYTALRAIVDFVFSARSGLYQCPTNQRAVQETSGIILKDAARLPNRPSQAERPAKAVSEKGHSMDIAGTEQDVMEVAGIERSVGSTNTQTSGPPRIIYYKLPEDCKVNVVHNFLRELIDILLRRGVVVGGKQVAEWPEDPSAITLALRLASSNPKSDVERELRGLRYPGRVVMLLLHQVEPHVNPPGNTKDTLYEDQYKDLLAVIDFVFARNSGLYDCYTNQRARDEVCRVIKGAFVTHSTVSQKTSADSPAKRPRNLPAKKEEDAIPRENSSTDQSNEIKVGSHAATSSGTKVASPTSLVQPVGKSSASPTKTQDKVANDRTASGENSHRKQSKAGDSPMPGAMFDPLMGKPSESVTDSSSVSSSRIGSKINKNGNEKPQDTAAERRAKVGISSYGSAGSSGLGNTTQERVTDGYQPNLDGSAMAKQLDLGSNIQGSTCQPPDRENRRTSERVTLYLKKTAKLDLKGAPDSLMNEVRDTLKTDHSIEADVAPLRDRPNNDSSAIILVACAVTDADTSDIKLALQGIQDTGKVVLLLFKPVSDVSRRATENEELSRVISIQFLYDSHGEYIPRDANKNAVATLCEIISQLNC